MRPPARTRLPSASRRPRTFGRSRPSTSVARSAAGGDEDARLPDEDRAGAGDRARKDPAEVPPRHGRARGRSNRPRSPRVATNGASVMNVNASE